jgi:hypothetical protein
MHEAALAGGTLTRGGTGGQPTYRKSLCLVGGLPAGLALSLASTLPTMSTYEMSFWEIVLGILSFSVFCATLVGLYTGGRACLQHVVLRRLLVQNGSAPWHYVAFLDYAAERLFLRKVGGGYIFIHRLLQEYFASLYKESGDDANQEASR